MTNKPVVLAVDDEELILQLIKSHLKDLEQPCTVEIAQSGEEAWELLEKNPEHYDVVLLDRMMDGMDGLEVLKLIRGHWVLSDIPVILQTSRSSEEDIVEGMQAGAYYYLTKPFEKALIRSVVNTVLQDRQHYKTLKQTLQDRNETCKLMDSANFSFRTLEEANALAGLLANACTIPEKVVTGLGELLLNAVEHGNLGISYDEKSQLSAKLAWQDEIEKRLELEEYKNKKAHVNIQRTDNSIEYTITDEGEGFDWKPFMDFSPKRIMDNHGRGIATANNLCFDHVEYQGKGNIVKATVRL